MLQLLLPGLGALHPKSHNAISGLSFTTDFQNQLLKPSFQKWIGHLAAQESLRRCSSSLASREYPEGLSWGHGPCQEHLLEVLGVRGVCWNFPPCPALWDAQTWGNRTQLCSAWSGRAALTYWLSSTEKMDYILYIRLCGVKHCWIWKANYFLGKAYRIFFPLKSLMTVFMGKFLWVAPRLKGFFMRQMEMFFPRVSNI